MRRRLFSQVSRNDRHQFFAGEVFPSQLLHVGRRHGLYAADVLVDDGMVAAAEDVLDRNVGNAERPVEDTHHLADHNVLHERLSGGVGVGGVLEPVQAAPVIIEDDCFIGSRAIVVEGAHICRESVLGAGVVITGSTHIIDVTEAEPKQYKGYVPAGSVVIPGSYPKRFPAGEYGVPCALIIGRRKESTDKKTSLTAALRDFGVSV